MATNKKTPLEKLKQRRDPLKQPLTLELPKNPSRARARYVASQKPKKSKPWEQPDGKTDYSKMPWSIAIAKGVSNLPTDFNRALDETALMFTEWDVTAEALGTLAAQAIWKPFSFLKPEQMAYNFLRMTTPGALPNIPESKLGGGANRRSTQVFDLLIDVYRENYDFSDGGEGIKRYIAEEPTAFLEDAAMVATLFLGGSGILAKGVGSGLKLTPKQRTMFNFGRFSRSKLGRHVGSATNYLKNTFAKIPDGIKYYGDRAYYIGTGVKEGGYEPGHWVNLAHMTLEYMDPLSAPLLAGTQALELTIGGIANGINSGKRSSRRVNDFTEWLYDNHEGWDINSVEELQDFMKTSYRQYNTMRNMQEAERFVGEMFGQVYDFPQSDDIIRAKAPDSIHQRSQSLTSGVEWEFLLEGVDESSGVDTLVDRMINSIPQDELIDELDELIHSLSLDTGEEYREMSDFFA